MGELGRNGKNLELSEVVYTPSTYGLDKNLLQPNRGRKQEKGFLYFAVLTTCCLMLTCGTTFTWTSPMVPLLKSNDTNVNPLGQPISPYQESLVAVLMTFGATAGALTLGKLADFFGRKCMLILFSMFELAAYVTMAFAHHIYYLYVGRLVQGLVFGFAISILPLYIAEITEDHNRGKFGSLIGLFIVIGNLYGYAVGPLVDFRSYCLLCALPLVVNIVLFTFFIPESPMYAASKGDRQKAKLALKKFRDLNARELEKALLDIEQILRASTTMNSGCKGFFQIPVLRKGLIISVGLNLLQQASGINAILGFLGPIFDSARMGISGNASAILVGVMQVVGVLISSVLIERMGRRLLALLSTLFCCISLFVLGFYFYFKIIDPESIEKVFWLPFLCLVVFVVSYGIGLSPVPLVVMSEIFSNDYKSVAASFSMFSSGVAASISIFAFPLIQDFLGVWWCFWIFSGICAVGVVFVYFIVPETKGKNFLEIQKMLNS